MFSTRFMENFREWRQKTFSGLGPFFLKLGITANMMTFMALLFGLAAVYLLFENNLLFILFALLHLLADGIDGIIARTATPTVFGSYFDHIADQSITVLVIVKIGWFLQDYFAYVAAFLFLFTQAIHFISKRKTPVLFTRTLTLLMLLFYVPSVVPITTSLPTLAYLITGVVSVYSLARQLQYYAQFILRK